MSAPLLRAAQAVFDRVVPTRVELEAEVAAAAAAGRVEVPVGRVGGGGGHLLTPTHTPGYVGGGEEMMGCAPPPPLTPTTAGGGGASGGGGGGGSGGACIFAGNDDASVKGCMANALRWQAQAHRIILVQGRAAYEGAVGELLVGSSSSSSSSPRPRRGVKMAEKEAGKEERVVWEERGYGAVVSPTPLALHSAGDHLAGLSRPLAWEYLTCHGAVLPADTATELGTFLLWALSYDTLVTLAVNGRRVGAASRPPRGPPGEVPTFLPATLALLPRIAAHAGVLLGHCSYTSAASGGVLAPCKVPLWVLSEDGSTWSQVAQGEEEEREGKQD